MKKIFIFIYLFSALALADLDQKILIHGTIGNAFDKEKVKVTDSHQQTYFLPKSVFPQKFKFEKDQKFNIEISEDLFNSLKIKN